MGLGVTAAALSAIPLAAEERLRDPRLQRSLDALETWLTRPDDFRDVSRGKPLPHSLSEEKRKEVGLTRETWQLEVLSDSDNPSRLRKQLSKEDGTAFDFQDLMQMAKEKAVLFPKNHDVPQHRLPAREWHLGGRTTSRHSMADAAARESSTRFLSRLSQRRPEADVS